MLLDEKNELYNRRMHISGAFESTKVDIQSGKDIYFGRTIVEEITGLKPSGASKLIKLLLDSNVIMPVSGHGKGKYRFQ